MSTDMQPNYAPPRSSGGSWVFPVVMGCAGISILSIVGCGLFGFFAFRYAASQIAVLSQEYTDRGYTQVMGQVIAVNKSPSEKTVYLGQVILINTPIDQDIAIVGQEAEIKANINGNLEFKGQVLRIHEDVVIKGDLIIAGAQVVIVDGTVEGEMSGSFQVLKMKGVDYANGQLPPKSSTTTPDENLDPKFQIELDEDRSENKPEKMIERCSTTLRLLS